MRADNPGNSSRMAEAVMLSKKIAKELEVRLKNFPGQIKVTVIRETRAVATAR